MTFEYVKIVHVLPEDIFEIVRVEDNYHIEYFSTQKDCEEFALQNNYRVVE